MWNTHKNILRNIVKMNRREKGKVEEYLSFFFYYEIVFHLFLIELQPEKEKTEGIFSLFFIFTEITVINQSKVMVIMEKRNFDSMIRKTNQ